MKATRQYPSTIRSLLLMLLALFCTERAAAQMQGVPFMRNYTPQEYKAHNRNFDIITSKEGLVFAANFEGLLFYDKARWHMLHTPGTQRLTAVFRDSDNRIWTGGYNYIGYVEANTNGVMKLHPLDAPSEQPLKGEVNWIWEKNGEIQFLASDKKIYRVNKNSYEWLKDGRVPTTGSSVFSDINDVTQTQELEYGLKALATNGRGLIIVNQLGVVLEKITEDNGLCSNNVNHITYDGHGTIWGATDNGIFAVSAPSAYSRFGNNEGLKGEVLSIGFIGDHMFVGTLNGLYTRSGKRFAAVPAIHHACWQLQVVGEQMLAATSGGIFRIGAGGTCRQLTSGNSTAVMAVSGGFLSGELDGVYQNSYDGMRRKLTDMERVTRIYQDDDNNLWLQNMYGQISIRPAGKETFQKVNIGNEKEEIGTLVIDEDVTVVTTSAVWKWNGSRLEQTTFGSSRSIDFPQLSYTDGDGLTWLTNNEGKHLYVVKNKKLQPSHFKWIKPLADLTVRTVNHNGKMLWLGGDFGLVGVSRSLPDPNIETKPNVRIRNILLHQDSLLWGGVGTMPNELPLLGSSDRNLTFVYSIDFPSVESSEFYHYRINGGAWSPWANDYDAELTNQPYGNYTFEVQAMDASGNLSNIAKIKYTIQPPFFMRWYMFIVYALILALLLLQIYQYRTRRLLKDKEKLEGIIKERTAEIAQQKDEIEEKSHSLEQTLNELHQAQKELVRQEKMATAGKLTQGLIDRILNPLNYINNFSKLSTTLLNDVEANIDDEQEHMDEENFEDTKDVLGMLRQNLQKVMEHGVNTTRTLKAMEEMLKERTGNMEAMDLNDMLNKNYEMLNGYYHKDIEETPIKTSISTPGRPVRIMGNAEQLSKTVMSMLENSIFAVKKKASKTDYVPTVSVRLEESSAMAVIHLYDNGIGIEDTILEKIFDPFFTTKTTSEGSGVGLYLSKEIAQNHGGDIRVKSVKDEYTEFIITLPLLSK